MTVVIETVDDRVASYNNNAVAATLLWLGDTTGIVQRYLTDHGFDFKRGIFDDPEEPGPHPLAGPNARPLPERTTT